MRLTEEEAKTKQCRITAVAMIPQAQTRNLMSAGQPDQIAYGFSFCLASACCHWRYSGAFAPVAIAVNPDAPRREGYCGLAGKPE
jgi:hypothetical protein